MFQLIISSPDQDANWERIPRYGGTLSLLSNVQRPLHVCKMCPFWKKKTHSINYIMHAHCNHYIFSHWVVSSLLRDGN